MRSALVVAKQFANQMKEALSAADPTTSAGCQFIRDLVAFAGILNAYSIRANDLAGDNTWNIATISAAASSGSALGFAMNTCATTLGIAVSATDFACLGVRMVQYQTLSRQATLLEKTLASDDLNVLERHELESKLESCRQGLKNIRQEHFSVDNLVNKFLSAGVNMNYFASHWMGLSQVAQSSVTAVGAYAFGAFLAVQGAKGVYDDVKLLRANQSEIKGLKAAQEKLEIASLSPSAKMCAKNVIALKLDHAKHAEKNRRILSFVKNTVTIFTGIASTGIIGGPAGLAVCLTLSLAVRLVESVCNNKPQIVSFLTSLPSLWGGAQDHPRVRYNSANKMIKDCRLEQESLNKQIQECVTSGKFGQVSCLQERLVDITKLLEVADESKNQAQMELNQAKLSYFITADCKASIDGLHSQLSELSNDPQALQEFQQALKEDLGIELSGSSAQMYNQIASFVLASPNANSTLAKFGAA